MAGVKGAYNCVGKCSQEQTLPSRFAMQTLTKGDPSQRSMNNYANKTPGVGDASPSINNFGMGAGMSSGSGIGY